MWWTDDKTDQDPSCRAHFVSCLNDTLINFWILGRLRATDPSPGRDQLSRPHARPRHYRMLYSDVKRGHRRKIGTIEISLPYNVEHAVNSLDVGKEGIPETLSVRGTLDKTSNIRDLKICRIHGWRLPEITQEVLILYLRISDSFSLVQISIASGCNTYISGIRNRASRLVRFNRAKWVVLGSSTLLG